MKNRELDQPVTPISALDQLGLFCAGLIVILVTIVTMAVRA